MPKTSFRKNSGALAMGNLFGHLNIFTEFSMKIDPKLHNYPNEKKSNILEHKKTI